MSTDPFGGFGGPPPVFMFFFTLIAVLIIGAILFAIIKGISQWSRNNSQPVLTVAAVVKAKRSRVSGGGETHSSTYYYTTFEFESGDRLELQVKDEAFGLMAEGDQGRLTFQGTRFLEFAREKETQRLEE